MNVIDPPAPSNSEETLRPVKQERFQASTSFWLDLVVAISVVGDVIAFLEGMLLAFNCRAYLNTVFVPTELIPLKASLFTYSGHFIFGTVLFLALAVRLGMYTRNNVLRLRQSLIAAMNTSLLWAGLYLFLSLLFSFKPFISRLFVVFSTVLGFVFVIGWRWLLLRFIEKSGLSKKLRLRLLVVGWNEEVNKLAESIMLDRRHPYDIIGCVPSAHNEYRLPPPPQVKRLGDYNEIIDIHQRDVIDIILIGDLNPSTGEIIALSEFCQREMIQFKVVPTYFQILISGLHLETISGVPVLGVERLPLDSLLNRAIKRTLDIIGAIVGLILCLPLFLIFGIAVYRESPGTIFYRQERMGRRGRCFIMYKIRSMRLDAEKQGGAQWAKPNDDRRLKIGAFMRKWNIDEVPQFWNVLKGEMSLVGPRPERPELIKDFKDQIRHYNARHNVKPGMTGWAQIHGLRGDTDLNERLRYDLYYLENWTPVLDVYIMLMTFYRNKNAY